MNELDVLDVFYDQLRAEGHTRQTLFISLDELIVSILQQKLKTNNINLQDLHHYADICIANEWLERTTADPGYNYLSLTEAGLQIAISYQYSDR